MKAVVITVTEENGRYLVGVWPRGGFSTRVLEGGTLEEALAAVGEAVPRPQEGGNEPH